MNIHNSTHKLFAVAINLLQINQNSVIQSIRLHRQSRGGLYTNGILILSGIALSNGWSSESARKKPSIGVLIKRCSQNIQQFYRRTPMPKNNFN